MCGLRRKADGPAALHGKGSYTKMGQLVTVVARLRMRGTRRELPEVIRNVSLCSISCGFSRIVGANALRQGGRRFATVWPAPRERWIHVADKSKRPEKGIAPPGPDFERSGCLLDHERDERTMHAIG